MKIASIITLVLFVVWVLLAIADLWFDIVSWAVFIKITMTLALLIVLSVIISITKRELTGNTSKDK